MLTAADRCVIHLTRDGLVITVAPEALTVCDDCPDLHVLVLDRPSRAQILALAAGLMHLADHHMPADDAEAVH